MKSSKVHIFHRMMENFHYHNITIMVIISCVRERVCTCGVIAQWFLGVWRERPMLEVKTAFPEVIVFKFLTSQDPTPSHQSPCSCLTSQHRVVGSISVIKNTLEQRKVGWKKLSSLPGTHSL